MTRRRDDPDAWPPQSLGREMAEWTLAARAVVARWPRPMRWFPRLLIWWKDPWRHVSPEDAMYPWWSMPRRGEKR